MRDTDIRTFLAELYEAGQQNDAHEQERSKKMLNLEPDTAQFLNILIRSSRRALHTDQLEARYRAAFTDLLL
jgi:hypothetical protein